MSISKYVVRLKDSHDTEHSATVYAESLYEAVVRGLKMLEHVGWESDTNETIKRVEVEIHQEPTRHIVDVPKLLKWVQDTAMSMSPAQDYRKEKLRKLLGIKKVERTKR
jgi:MoaA/NifB/PqqE/SkfB family radical SAM enzyme